MTRKNLKVYKLCPTLMLLRLSADIRVDRSPRRFFRWRLLEHKKPTLLRELVRTFPPQLYVEMAKQSYTDLLIIGAGPAGLMAAAWASQYGVTTRFIDDKPGKVKTGHADGLTCRTLEIFDSFGVADTVLKEAFFDVEMRSWVSSRYPI